MEDSKNLLYRFRIFDITAGEYIDTETQTAYIEPNGDVMLMRLEPHELHGKVPWFVIASDETDRYTVERCIGRKDSNGNPVFEGDVVRFFSEFEQEYVTGVITYSQYECRYIAQRLVDGQLSWLTVAGAEDAPAVPDGWALSSEHPLTIVGNIHTFK